MLSPEAMHAVFEGIGKYYSWEVLMINIDDAKKRGDFVPAFDNDFTAFDSEDKTIPDKCRPDNEAAEKDIHAIHRLLVAPFRDEPENDNEDGDLADDHVTPIRTDEEGETVETLAAKLAKKWKTALIFVCWSLGLARSPVPPDPRTGAQIKWEEYLVRVTREQLAELLLEWVSCHPPKRTKGL
jgi:hypothetical protein